MTYVRYYLITDPNTDQHPDLGMRVQRRFGLSEGETMREATPEEAAECSRIDQSVRDSMREMKEDSANYHGVQVKESDRLRALPYDQVKAREAELQKSLLEYVSDTEYRHRIKVEEVDSILHAYAQWVKDRKGKSRRDAYIGDFLKDLYGMFGNNHLDSLTLAAVNAELRRKHIETHPIDRDTLLGAFEVTGTVLRLSDPCYEKGTWCSGTVPDALPGRWIGKCRYAIDWGLRSFYVAAFHDDSNPSAALFHQSIPVNLADLTAHGWEHVDAHVGVDSGQAGIFDDAHYRDDRVITVEPEFARGESEPGSRWYGACCDLTLSGASAGVIPHGVVSGSGMGDGGYDAYVRRNPSGQVIAVVIDFKGINSGVEYSDIEDDDPVKG